MPQKRLPEASDGSRGTGDVVELTSDPGTGPPANARRQRASQAGFDPPKDTTSAFDEAAEQARNGDHPSIPADVLSA